MQTKTLSGVVGSVLSAASSPRIEMSDLAKLISRDPMLSARVLQAANSPAFRTSRSVVMTLPDAIRNIGCVSVKNIAAALGVFEAMPDSSADGFNPIRCWQHSFAVAQLSQRLCLLMDPEQTGVAYLVGLCHDLGEILLHTQFAAEYRQVLDFRAKTGKPLDELARVMLGMTPAEIAVTILRCLNLPETIREAVEAMHSTTPGGDMTSVKPPLARLLLMAQEYANGVLLASSPVSLVAPISQASCMAAIGQANPSCPDAALLRAEIVCLTGTLARLPSGEEAQLMRPMYPFQNTRLWLARDPAFSSFDPIAAALGSMAELEISDSLPSSEQAGASDGLVVIAPATSTDGLSTSDVERCQSARQHRLPILYLAGKIEKSLMQIDSPPEQFPLPLERLAAFVESTRKAAPKARAA